MVHGIGIDIIDIHRMQNILNSTQKKLFLERVFTEKERAEAEKQANYEIYYAKLFSGKEAIYKAISTNACSIELSDIEILYKKNNLVVNLSGKLRKIAEERNFTEIKCSSTSNNEYVVTFATVTYGGT